MRLPGCRPQRQLRGWTIGELARRAGLDYKSAMRADRGDSVAERTARKLARALADNPPPAVMAELLAPEGTLS